MSTQPTAASPVRFGDFELDIHKGELRRKGRSLKLQPQPARVLSLLVSRAGETLTRQEIAQEVWGSETFVDFEQGLNFAVRQIRAVLEDDADHPQYIETIPKRGYRFIGEIENTQKPDEKASSPISDSASAERNAMESGSMARVHKPLLGLGAGLALAMVLIALLAWNPLGWRLLGANSSPNIQSLAVLPLQNLSQDPEQEYFSEGMTDELITDLAQISSLKVISRTSSMRYKQSNKSLPEIARELVEGSVQRSGDHVLITAQLIEAQKDRHLWAESYERDVRDILGLQGEVASDIATQISVKLTTNTQERGPNAPEIDPAVYEDYLRGRYFFERWNAEGRDKALAYFQRAIAKDRNYAAAYAGLADTLIMRSYFGESTKPDERANGIAAAQEALRLDGSLAEAHASLGLALLLNLHWPDAERELQSSVSLNPNCSMCHIWYAYYLTFVRRFPDAAQEINKAQALDPVSSPTYVAAGVMRYFSRNLDGARHEYQKAIELDPSNPEAYKNLADIYLEKQDCAQATRQFVRAEELVGQPQNGLALIKAFRLSGCRGMLTKQLEFYADPANPDYYPMYAADNAAMLGNNNLASSSSRKHTRGAKAS